ncbi:ergothioneine biosynthesis protein EgtB [Pseudoalteromonas sp. S2893]|uniref:ergothioneine biosynthesis protein EgtB n=1 Tax=Pseudoalteromonas sp. S2893 TaxID=579530 RepID=UPI00110BDEE0|nr:ergothioneine biosynthesis protein EgtB [Pseudoalteromonas sp. S2893]TMP17163.1 ergothioneine biosynthesis protein EgtB [Pseudoalteromonas sp. S2893]
MLNTKTNEAPSTEKIHAQFQSIRQHSLTLIKNLSAEDCQLQAMEDASPMKWHLAHTTWFFETFLLAKYLPNYTLFDEQFKMLFNSYYNGIGEQFKRANRGCLSRPSLEVVLRYRAYVDNALNELLQLGTNQTLCNIIELGLNHEQQHQELMLMDIKYNFSVNPSFPAYSQTPNNLIKVSDSLGTLKYTEFSQSITNIGADAKNGFSYDNEQPKHQALIHAFSFANRLVTNREYLQFIEAGGYKNPSFWLSDGWASINTEQLSHPLYWQYIDGQWFEFTLYGLQPLNLDAPVSHVSYFEAAAYANFVNARLPTEFEWEYVAQQQALKQQHNDLLTPSVCKNPDVISQLSDTCWQWTNSAYLPYPGFKPFSGAAGEYNGKFMNNQMVLRGGCVFTPKDHLRQTYRNFFYPHQAWMCSGIRLAKDIL